MCTNSCGNGGLLGAADSYIKVSGSNFVAVEGSATLEKLEMGLLKMPFKQYFKTRMFLPLGASNQPINYANLGDNVTFLAIAVYYDTKSKNEADNFITYHLDTDPNTEYPIGQLLVLTGNSANRIPQIYLTNPNTLYPVKIEVLCACIDLTVAFFNNASLPNNNNLTIGDLNFGDIQTHVLAQSIKVINALNQTVLYMTLADIAAIERSGHILIIDDNALGRIYLDFVNTYNALQALSALSYILKDPINRTLPQPADNTAPVITFTANVILNASTVTLSAPPFLGTINKTALINHLIDNVTDAVDGLILLQGSNLDIEQAGIYYSQIITPGVYNIIFNVKDIAENNNQQVIILTVL
jgi:hypothetical protein